MIKKLFILIIVFCIYSCNLSLRSSVKHNSNCLYYFNLENENEYVFLKNKEFRKISSTLKTKYNAILVRQIFFFRLKKIYYCEYFGENNTIHCLILDKDLKLISKKEIQFDT